MTARELIDQRLNAKNKNVSLAECIQEISTIPNIRNLNEAQAKLKIIQRILSLLDWDIYRDIDPEHSLKTRKSVDYTLQVSGKNKVFIEAKSPKEDLKKEKHQDQLFNYSAQKNPDLAILTNGILWWFYLPRAEGEWSDRKFYTIDILEQEIEDSVDKFGLLLSRQNVESGEAFQHAESILESRQREKAIRKSLPEVWNSVIKEPSESLVKILIERVLEICDFKPENSEILRFMRSHQEKWLLSPESKEKILPLPINDSQKSSDTKTPRQTKKQIDAPKRMQIDRESYELGPKQGYKILVNTANWLIDKGDLKPSDCPIKKVQGKSDLINKTDNGLETPRPLKNGLYIDTHGIIKKTVIPYAKRLLKKYGYDPEILQIEW